MFAKKASGKVNSGFPIFSKGPLEITSDGLFLMAISPDKKIGLLKLRGRSAERGLQRG
jgi:hypothetical protein